MTEISQNDHVNLLLIHLGGDRIQLSYVFVTLVQPYVPPRLEQIEMKTQLTCTHENIHVAHARSERGQAEKLVLI